MSQLRDATDRPARILIVDDHLANRQVLELILLPEGFSVEMAASGEDALAQVALAPPDLILLDVTMPGLSGYDVTRRLKDSYVTKGIPIIMVTALGDRDAMMVGLRAGAEDFLIKPVDPTELCLRVRNLLRLKGHSDDHDNYGQMLEGVVAARSEELVQSERFYRSTFDEAPVGIVHMGLDRQWLRVNQRLCDLLGYSHEQLQTPDVQERLNKQAVAGETDALRDMAAGRLDRHVIEHKRYHRSDGTVMSARVVISVRRDAKGQPQHFIKMIEDITERRTLDAQFGQAIDALRISDERMQFALESAGVGIWDMDCTTGALRWSDTLEAHYGVTPGTFGGTFEAFVERIHPDDRASALETITNAMKAGTDFSVQNRSIWPDGTVRWLDSRGRFQCNVQGRPVRGVGISLDVTERRGLEDRYRQAQKMEAVGRLAGGVAHDFNNLLTAILGYCELLLADINPADPRRADLIEIQNAGTRAAGLTRQLLAFSRKQILEPTLIDLNGLMTGMRAMLGRLIGEDVTIVLSPQPDLALVKADFGQVEQVLMNLAVNARDAMPRGGTLTIETADVDLDEHYTATHFEVKPGRYVALTVTDTGIGMTPEVQSHLFEPFFTTKEVGKGTGLGLATVHGIATGSGGSIGVYSEVGRGTSFKVYFPRADAHEVGAVVPLPVSPPQAAGGETVLVVEDAQALRDLTGRLLQRHGYRVLLAADADEAIRLFDQNPSIDVLLTDVVMPGASGPELTRQLAERRPMLKVLFMSGYTEDAIVQYGVLKPGIAFLHKPFTAEILGRKIREVLDHPAWQAGQSSAAKSAQSARPAIPHRNQISTGPSAGVE